MKAVKTIRSQYWMTASETKAVMEVLGEDALFVGGCVRNALLGAEVEDIDIATKLLPDEVMARLREAGIKVIPTGIDHGTVTAVVGKKSFEITTLRKDVETDGRRAVVAFADNWSDDAQRRDFTMNTLLADSGGQIFDPLDCGLADLEARKVVFVGDPAQRIAEDVLRILRFFRFHALYGEGPADELALSACREQAHKIAELSKERVTQEFFKIMSAEMPADILELMFAYDILKAFDFDEYDAEKLKHFCEFQTRYGLQFLASRLLVLTGFDLKNLETLQNALLIPKVFLKDIAAILNILSLPDLSDDHAVKVAVYKHGRVPTAQALMIELVQDRVMNGFTPKALDIVQNWDIPDFPVSGDDLIAEGFKPDRTLGEELAKREQAWIDNGFSVR